ncbi:MAG: alpha/beta hydrolase [Bacillus sp. (in: firmicutes)]
MKKKILIPLFAVLSIFSAIGIIVSNLLMFMKKKDDRFIQEREIKAGRLHVPDFESLPKQEVMLDSPFGYPLNCLFVSPHPTNKWMIFCHGITENKYNSIKYMNLFIKKGYNAIIYDHRRHGNSGGNTSSYGFYEKWDLDVIVKELKKREGNDVIFGIHGESMGAATTLLYAGCIRDDAAFYIADCPFSTLQGQVQYRIKKDIPLPSWLILPIGSLFLKMRDGYSLHEVSPLAAVKQINNPILFIHSENDDYIPVAMTKELYEAKKGDKQLFISSKGAHAQSFNENSAEYEKAIDHFLQSLPVQNDDRL